MQQHIVRSADPRIPASLVTIAILAALGCEPLPPVVAKPAELVVTVGGMRQRLHLKADALPQPATAVSIRGEVRVPETIAGSINLGLLTPERLPHFPKVLVIVIPQALLESSQALARYIDWRQAGGWEVIVGTESAWDRPTTRDGDDRQARIRAWLQRLYRDHDAGYLLLIGDPHPDHNGVPMRRTEPLAKLLPYYPAVLAESLARVPTDQYYADLESNWDCDGDRIFGEYPDDAGAGCADLGPELIVGRIPVYGSAGRLDQILQATLDFEQARDRRHLDRAIFAGAFGGFRGQDSPGGDGSYYEEDEDLAAFLDRAVTDLPQDMAIEPYRLFEAEGIVTSAHDREAALGRDALLEAWRQGASTVAWGGHGSEASAHRQIWLDDDNEDGEADYLEVQSPPFIATADAQELQQAPGAIVHMMSCLNGAPEEPANLGTALLGRGAVVTASSSRSTVGDSGLDWEPRPDLASATTSSYYFVQLVQRGFPAGEALAYTRWALSGTGWNAYEDATAFDMNGYGWLVKFGYNLYGDPTVGIHRCGEDSECDDGLPCNGTESCMYGYCVAGEPVVCEAGDSSACTASRCDNTTGSCAEKPRTNGYPCDDGAWCTRDDSCLAGACVGQAVVCPEHAGYRAICDERVRECVLDPERPPEPPGTTIDPACGALSPATSELVLASGLLLPIRSWRRRRSRTRLQGPHPRTATTADPWR